MSKRRASPAPLSTQSRLYLLRLVRPRGPSKAERVPNTRVRDVARASNRAELRDVNNAARAEDVLADVDVLDEPEDEHRRVLVRLGVVDVDGLEELCVPLVSRPKVEASGGRMGRVLRILS